MSAHQCDGCGEFRDVNNGKCHECWMVEAVYLRTNITAVVGILKLDRRRTKRERETEAVLRGALEPIERAAYVKGRRLALDVKGCGVFR